MKVMITVLGLLIILAGAIPFLGADSLNVLPGSIPSSGMNYAIIIIVIGALGLVYGFINKMIMGAERIITIIIGLLTVLGGILPLISELVPAFIPTSGPVYSGIIIIVGLIGFVYGVMGMG
tara:strand:- start:575 stop:937 length:363 start_codon:yes stop_codon:yes gene_type:complete